MLSFQSQNSQQSDQNHIDFIDRVTCVDEHETPRFATLIRNLQMYWQAGGEEVLPLADGVNRILQDQVLKKAQLYYQSLRKYLPAPDACVLVALTDEEKPKILLTQRASQLGSHAGEVSFVGGKKDKTDSSSLQVALREAFEEVALCSDQVKKIGYLPMQLSKHGLLVRPVVVQLSKKAAQSLQANHHEIEKIFWLSLDQLLTQEPVNYVFQQKIGGESRQLHTPAWLVSDVDQTQVVWGLTGRILANLRQIGYHLPCHWYYHLK